MRAKHTKTWSAIAVAVIVTLGVTACAGGGPTTRTPEQAQAEAVGLLRKTQAAADLPWPETPAPSAEPCSAGVRFNYFVPVEVKTDANSVAQTLRRLWRSEGLTVSSSQEDFGESGGVLYSATADADAEGGAGAGYQVSATSVAVQITSPCVEGSPDDE
ncbi:hypothetical protein [Curtobacterium flaccumfaciens]|uniref:hypothetical protein n=1 Tax=Curtobacterium flaccumfaciens TaxID=2035 RepID=UPI002175D0C9|nr:hypothetical protein [Curtobacterium flaccumfaciens]MCS5493379.1 hypothetical protein [Curtobacterium flaccumfaciens pv. flaccumfaciens]